MKDAATINLDVLTASLRQWRMAAGGPSYEELARQVHALRLKRAENSHQVPTRPSKATVYAVYQDGRRRLDLQLCLDLLTACGADKEALREFKETHFSLTMLNTLPPTASPRTDAVDPAPSASNSESSPLSGSVANSLLTRGHNALRTHQRRIAPKHKSLFMVAGLGLNLLGHLLEMALGLPLYLDMLGTLFVALAVGPWAAVAVGLGTNLVEVMTTGNSALPFALVNMAGGLMWGYGARALKRITIPRLTGLTLGVALMSTVLSVPIQIIFLSGHTASSTINFMMDLYQQAHKSLWGAQFATNISLSVADKLVSLVAVLILLETLDVFKAGHETAPNGVPNLEAVTENTVGRSPKPLD